MFQHQQPLADTDTQCAAGTGHAEVAGDIVFSVAPFLMADDDCGTPVYASNSADEGRIVSAAPIAVKLDPLVANCLNVIEGAGAARVTGKLQPLHGGQAAENFLSQLGGTSFEFANFVGDIDAVFFGEFANLVNSGFEFGQGLFKI